MNSLKKISCIATTTLACLTATLSQAYEHKGLQYSVGVGANFSKNTFVYNDEYSDESEVVKNNRGYNYHLDFGYGLTENITTFISIHNIAYKSSLKDYDTPKPFWMQQAFIGPMARYYLKGNEPGFYLQAGVGYGYFSISELASFSTSRHFGDAFAISVGYEVDMFWNLQLNYLNNKIQSKSIDDTSLNSHALAISLNFHPRSTL